TGVSQASANTARITKARIRAGAGPRRRRRATVTGWAFAAARGRTGTAGAATGFAALMSGTPSTWTGPGRGPGARPVPGGRSGAGSCLHAPSGGDHHVGDRDDDDQEEEDVRDRRGVAQAVPGEADLVDVQQHRAGGAAGTAAGHLVDLVEYLQRGEHLQHEHQHRRRRELRQGDRAELLPGAGAVEGGGLVELVGDVLER